MKRKTVFFKNLICGLLALAPFLAWADHYVAQDGQTPVSPYTSWENAASNIQEAIDQAVDGSTVWVKPGTYGRPPVPLFADNATNMVNITKRLTVRSFSGNPADTIIDAGGEISNRCVRIDMSTNGALTPPFRISGFTLTNGYANGGGVLINMNTTLRTGIVDNCVITDNRGIEKGGGIYTSHYGSLASVIVSNSVVRNSSNGGMYKSLWGTTIVTGCRFEDNEEYGLDAWSGVNLIENSVFTGNRKVYESIGSALTFWNSATTNVVRNCLFARNVFIHTGTAYGIGGAAIGLSNNAQAELYNCTIVSNTALGYGAVFGGIYVHGKTSQYQVWNSIIRENIKLYNGQISVANYGGNSSPTLFFTNTCTAPITAYPNAGNLNADPMFADFDGQDFRLTKASPCLNAGVNQNWMVGATDLDGHLRIDRNGPGIVDMGCYEFVYPGSMIVIR